LSGSMALVGLDVHQAQSVAAVLDPVSGELRVERLRGAPAGVVLEFLERLERPVRAVYEAGPTGFGLARAATERGLDVRVIAPGSIPRGSGDRVKTDRRDAKRLVRLFAAGELSYVFVPSEADERFRDLVRCIDDARKDLMRSRHRLSKFLLRRGLRFPGRQWTQPHQRSLLTLCFDDALSQAVFIDYCCAVDARVQRRATLIGVLEQAVPASSHAETVARLRCFRGIDTLSAAGLCADDGRFERFAKPTLLPVVALAQIEELARSPAVAVEIDLERRLLGACQRTFELAGSMQQVVDAGGEHGIVGGLGRDLGAHVAAVVAREAVHLTEVGALGATSS
jgi:transposase